METTKYTAQRTAMKLAHTIAKTLDKAISYAKRLGQAIKMAWIKIKATFVWTAIGTDAIERMESAKAAIENGGKWNGIVYGKPAINKNQGEISVYVSGNIFTFRVWKEDFLQAKKEVEAFLVGANTQTTRTEGTTWLVDGKPVTNNLNWGQMWDMYGTDFE